MKRILLIGLVLFFTGCLGFGKVSNNTMATDNDSKMLFTNVLDVENDCSLCDDGGKKVYINGVRYYSDTALRCCLQKNMIDTNLALKKVYFHRITDDRQSARSIYYTRSDGLQVVFNSNPRLEVLFYMFLEHELNSRGILVVDTQTSPYTYRLDFSFEQLRGDYNEKSEYLSGSLFGRLTISNINFNKKLNISAKQSAQKLQASKSAHFDFFIALLVKQTAMKVADEISKL